MQNYCVIGHCEPVINGAHCYRSGCTHWSTNIVDDTFICTVCEEDVDVEEESWKDGICKSCMNELEGEVA